LHSHADVRVVQQASVVDRKGVGLRLYGEGPVVCHSDRVQDG
jgi:hypothetical protein